MTACRRGHLFDEQNTYVRPSGSRECRTCKNAKKRERYAAGERWNTTPAGRAYAKKWREANRESRKAYIKQWQANNPGYGRLRVYGMTAADYQALLAEQGERCACCRDPLDFDSYRAIHIDHCHETGRVRGILCRSCNITLGHAKDDRNRLAAAIAYLDRQREVPEDQTSNSRRDQTASGNEQHNQPQPPELVSKVPVN